MVRRLLAVFILTIFLAVVFVGGVVAQSFFSLTEGNKWRGYSELAKITYVVGFLDAMGLMKYGYDRGETQQFASTWVRILGCISSRKITVGQTYAVINKWMNDNPDKWDYNMSIIMLASLAEMCP